MFFKPLLFKKTDRAAVIDKSAVIANDYDEIIREYVFRQAKDGGNIRSINIKCGFPDRIKSEAGSSFTGNREAFAIEISDGTLNIYSAEKCGALYAVSTVISMAENGELCDMLMYDSPDVPIRGYRVYIPGTANMQYFTDAVEFMVKYRYNFLMLEIGGAMEYKRRPEINRHWVEYCSDLTKTSDKAHDIQHRTYPWHKNSIHVDNGFGTFMTQDEIREIIRYCKDRCIEIIPEVPSLSHCDYLVGTYPELNERIEDKYPDTYCPSNPKSYEILFDILEEIIDVFKPRYINIGHDEFYTVCICPKCKDKDPVQLYVDDISKINDFLKAHNIKSIMWCEKLFDIIPELDEPWGGRQYRNPGEPGFVPQMTSALGKIPKDVILLDWYWSLSPFEQKKALTDNGYTVWYGNFNSPALNNYRDCMNLGIRGGFASNWGSFKPEYMQRNFQYLALLGNAYAFWNRDFDSPQKGELLERSFTELYNYINRKTLEAPHFEVVHTTTYFKDYEVFYDGVFIVDELYNLGYHLVTYNDGSTVKLPVKYGHNIANSDLTLKSKSSEYREAAGRSIPCSIDGKTYYKTVYPNPYPDKEIDNVKFVKTMNKDFEVITDSIITR